MSAPARSPRRFGSVRSGEGDRFAFFFALTALITLAQTVGLAGAEALFLNRLGAQWLPHTFVAASVTTVLASLIYAYVVGRARNDRVLMAMLLLASAALAAGTYGAWHRIDAVLPAMLCLWFVTQAIFVNHFWTFAGDFFDTLAAKRLFPSFTVGASSGGLAGGLVAYAALQLAPAEILLATWAGTLGLAAVMVRAAQARLRRWGPLELEEEDETSVEGLRGALRYLQASSLGRWLVFSTVAMITSLLIAQFLYSDILAERFPDERELALFIALFLAASNLVEIVIELWVTPVLIHRLGVGAANLMHPLATLASFGALAFEPALGPALFARANRELLENATANPVRNLIYNALPLRLRGRVRAFLEGMVMYSGMSVAGLALLLLDEPPLRVLCGLGGILGALYLFANLRVRRAYLRTLVDELRSGRVDLEDLSEGMGTAGAQGMVALWDAAVANAAHAPPQLLEQLAPGLVEQGVTDPIVVGLGHPALPVRRVCARALAPVEVPAIRASLAAALSDPEPAMRRAVIRSLRADDLALQRVHHAVREHLDDPDATVRAEAAVRSGADGAAALRAMALSEEREAACAALQCLPEALCELALARCDDADPAVRAAALQRLSDSNRAAAVPLAQLTAALQDGDVAIRRAAAAVLAARDDAKADLALATAMGDPLPEMREFAVRVLADRGDRASDLILEQVRSDRENVADSALRALAGSGVADARVRLVAELRHHVRAAWTALLSHEVIQDDGTLATRFLHTALADAAARHQRLSFAIVGLVENSAVVRSIDKALRFGNARSRADALEVLSHLADRESVRLLVLMLEAGPVTEKLAIVRSQVPGPADTHEAFALASQSGERWLLAAAEARRGRDAILSEDTMEHLLALGRVPLFSRLSLEQLEAVDRITREVEYLRDEVIFREGDPGGELYLIVDGEVDVVNSHGTEHEVWLNRLGPGNYFGEMAILDGAPRSATIVARRDARLLRLEGARLNELILEMPEIAFEILRVLTARLRSSDRRVQELVRGGADSRIGAAR